MFQKKVHARISRSNISMERYTTNPPISRNPLIQNGIPTCLESVIPYKDAVIEMERREGGQKLSGEREIVTPVELHRFNVTELGYYVCDKSCNDPTKCSGIKIKQSEFYNDDVTADELVKKYQNVSSNTREEATIPA